MIRSSSVFKQCLRELSEAVGEQGIFLHLEEDDVSRLHCMEAAAEAVPESFIQRFGSDHPIAGTSIASISPDRPATTIYFGAGSVGGKDMDQTSVGALIANEAIRHQFDVNWNGSASTAISLSRGG